VIVGVERRFEQEDRGDAAGHLLDVADLVFRQRAAQEFFFAAGKPLLDDLIAADGVFPDANRDVRPVGEVVQINVAGAVAELL